MHPSPTLVFPFPATIARGGVGKVNENEGIRSIAYMRIARGTA